MNKPSMIPYLTVKNTQETINFYRNVFGFTHIPNNEVAISKHAEMRFNDNIIMLCSECTFDTTSESPITNNIESPITLYFYINNVDIMYNCVVTKGVEAENIPTDQAWGDRMFSVIDINGYRFAFASKIKP